MEKANLIISKVFFTVSVLLGAGLLFAFSLNRMIQKNLRVIESGMKEYESGNYTQLLSPASYDEIGMLILQFNHMGMRIHELNELSIREQEEKQRLQYMVLEAQINPHFLYNTLGAVKWLAYEKEEDELAKLTDAIIRLLRFTVKNSNQLICLGEEIEYIRQYIYIQKARYEDAFVAEFAISDEAAAFVIIGFVLQPFVENSILHGLDNARKDGVIRVTAEVVQERLHLAVADNGRGMMPEKLANLHQKVQSGSLEKYNGFNGIGITNIIVRMKSVYGQAFEYQIDSSPGRGTRVTLMIPKKEDKDE